MTGSPKEITQDRKLTLMTTFRLNDCHSLDDFFSSVIVLQLITHIDGIVTKQTEFFSRFTHHELGIKLSCIIPF